MRAPTDRLRPCPFCGEAENLYIGMEDGIYFVRCSECGARGGDTYHPDNARYMWNVRANHD